MLIRPLICIPTFNNPRSIGAVVRDCLRLTDFPILVIDDGSHVPVTTFLPKDPRVTVVRNDQNLGKGSALQRGFAYGVGLGFTHMVSLDGDGQHFAKDIAPLLDAARASPWDLVIGCRTFDQSKHVPSISRFGRGFSNFWVRYQTSLGVRDSQSGFRVYPLFQVQTLSFFCRRFDFEIEVLVRLIWRGVAVRDVQIGVHYPPQSERVSHFHKFWDNTRITVLNIFLIVGSLMHSHRSPARLGVSVGLGIFIGCTPLFGLHSLLVAALSFLLRLNFVGMLVGSQISLPPMIPLLMGAAAFLAPAATPLGFAVGSLMVGVSLGLLGGMLVWVTARGAAQGRAAGRRWTGKSRGGTFGNALINLILRVCGLKAGYAVLYLVVPYFYVFAPRGRRASRQFWSVVRPEVTGLAREWLILKHLTMFGRLIMDHRVETARPTFTATQQGWEHVLDHKDGLLVVTAHVGGWEMAATLMGASGFRSTFTMVRHGSIDEKPPHVIQVATHEEGSVLRIREALLSGAVVGLMSDRPAGGEVELVPFFGKLAAFTVTPFRIAALCNVPVVFAFGFKGTHNAYHLFATRPRSYRLDIHRDRGEQHREWLLEYVRELERQVRAHPDQWLNFFPFWSEAETAVSRLHTQSRTQAGSTQTTVPPAWGTDQTRPVEEAPLPRAQ